MFLLKHISGIGFWFIQAHPWDVDFHLKRQILSVQPHCIPVSSFKKPILHRIHSRLFSLTMEWSRYLSIQPCFFSLVHTHEHSQPHKETATTKNSCTPTNPKRQNPGAKNNSLEWDGWRRTDYCCSNLWKADNKTHLKWLQRCYRHGGHSMHHTLPIPSFTFQQTMQSAA